MIDLKKFKKFLVSEKKYAQKERDNYQESNLNCGFFNGKISALQKILKKVNQESLGNLIKPEVADCDCSTREKQFIYGEEDTYEKVNLEIKKGKFNRKEGNIFFKTKKGEPLC